MPLFVPASHTHSHKHTHTHTHSHTLSLSHTLYHTNEPRGISGESLERMPLSVPASRLPQSAGGRRSAGYGVVPTCTLQGSTRLQAIYIRSWWGTTSSGYPQSCDHFAVYTEEQDAIPVQTVPTTSCTYASLCSGVSASAICPRFRTLISNIRHGAQSFGSWVLSFGFRVWEI